MGAVAKKREKALGLAGVLCLLFSGLVGAAEPIRLGAVVPLEEVAGRQSAKAMQLAVRQINQGGGVLGRPLELIVVDDGMNPEKGAAAIEKLATEDKVDFFVGGLSSSVHLAQVPVLRKYGKVTVWSGALSSKIEQAMAGQDWYFHLHPWDYQVARSYMEGWNALAQRDPRIQLNKWFIAYESGAFGTTSFRTHVEQIPAPATVVGVHFKSAAFGVADYQGVFRRAKAEEPDIFVWVGLEADALPLSLLARQEGFVPALFVGAPPGWPQGFGKSAASENVVFYGVWIPAMKNVSKASRDYAAAYRAVFHEEASNYFGPLAYSGVAMLAEAIRKAGSLESASVIAALEKLRYESPLGEPIAFAPSRVIRHQAMLRQKIMQWQKGVPQVVWPFELATASLIYPYRVGGNGTDRRRAGSPPAGP